MPYTINETRPYFDEHPLEAKTPWDVTYVLYKRFFLPYYKAAPRWRTYFHLKRMLTDAQYMHEELRKLAVGLNKNGVSLTDIAVCAGIALDEVQRRYVNDYEDLQIKEQGDIEADPKDVEKFK